MNRSIYAGVIKKYGDTAKVGFELEIFVPVSSRFSAEQSQKATPSIATETLDTIAEFEKYFNISEPTHRAIEAEYGRWLATAQDQYVEQHWSEYLSDDTGSKAVAEVAKNLARRSFPKANYPWTRWFKEAHTSGPQLIDTYALTPKFGWADGDQTKVYSSAKPLFGFAETAGPYAEALSAAIGVKIKVTGKDDTSLAWKISPDESIIPDGDDTENLERGVGLEIISPPLPVQEGLDYLKQICDFIDKSEAITNISTSIHVNLSIPGIQEKLDPLKLAVFMGDTHILQKFNRVGNLYTLPVTQDIIDNIQLRGLPPPSAIELVKMARAIVFSQKYRTVNLLALQKGYLEFRAAGGSSYHKRFEDLKEAVGRWLTVIDLACDPEKSKNEYYKKVSKLLQKSTSDAKQ